MLPIAISPCPNDTYLFYAWIKGLVGKTCPILPTFADIDSLNKYALNKAFPLIKVSVHCYGKICEDYILLPVGMALGFGVGPKIIGNTKIRGLEEISSQRIAIPGIDTSAHLLFDIFFKTREKVFCTYDQVIPLLKSGRVDLGLIIHETRFTFEKEGFVEIADLGQLWEETFSLPLPLGGIAVKKSLKNLVSAFCSSLRDSLLYARENPDKIYEFILSHSIEKDPEVVKKHIELYVNSETLCISNKGREATETLLAYGSKLGYYPSHEIAPFCNN